MPTLAGIEKNNVEYGKWVIMKWLEKIEKETLFPDLPVASDNIGVL